MKKNLVIGVLIAIIVGYVLYRLSADSIIKIPKNNHYKDGEYTGPVTDAFFGPMQVKAIVSGGKLVDVLFLQYPNDRPNSIAVNDRSNPLLRQEAIKAQSAQVDIVSGATQSSEAFQQSLAAALDQAK